MNWSTTLIALVILLSFAVSTIVFSHLPATVASHWNSSGEANGTMSRMGGVFLLPIITLALALLLVFLPRIDPLRKNILSFLPYYELFILFFTIFLTYLHFLTLLWNLGVVFDMRQWLSPGFAVFFYALGILLGHTKRNWFIGIRTPWTLQSDHVWAKTHHIGALFFRASGIILLAGFFFPALMLWFLFVPLGITVLVTVIYSYVVYKNDA